MQQWTRSAAKRVAALSIGLAVIGSSGLALADGHGPKQGPHRPKHAQHFDFEDLGSANWAQPALRLLVTQGVIRGEGNGQLQPNGQTTRAQMATMLGRLLGWSSSPPPIAPPVFHDNAAIPPWAMAFVQRAAKAGILRGEQGDDFEPQQAVTWAQAAVIIDRVFSFPSVPANTVVTDLQQLPYGPTTPGWAAAGVAADVSAGLFQGLLGQIYMPNQPVSRAELSVLLQRAEQLKPAVVAQANSVVVGSISAVQPGSLTVAAAQGEVTVPLTTGVVVYQGGVPSSIGALQAGEGVVIGIDGRGQGAFVEITSGGTATSGGGTVSGAVSTISTTQISIAESGASTATFVFAANLTVSGAASLAAIMPGDQVTLTFNAANLVTEIDVTAGPTGPAGPAVGGTVTGVGTSSITLAPAGGGGPFVYSFVSGGPSVEGLETTLSGVAIGDQVTLTLSAGGQVASIDVTATPNLAPSRSVNGVLVSADATTDQVVVLVYADNQPSLTTLSLPSGAQVTLGNSVASLGALQTGDPVAVAVDAQGQGVSVTASALPPGEQFAAGSMVADTTSGITVASGSGQATLPTGPDPVAVSGGSIVPLSGIALDTEVTAVSGAANGSLLLVVPA